MSALDSREDVTMWLRLAGADLAMQAEPVGVARAATYLSEMESVVALVGSRLHEQEFTFLRAAGLPHG